MFVRSKGPDKISRKVFILRFFHDKKVPDATTSLPSRLTSLDMHISTGKHHSFSPISVKGWVTTFHVGRQHQTNIEDYIWTVWSVHHHMKCNPYCLNQKPQRTRPNLNQIACPQMKNICTWSQMEDQTMNKNPMKNNLPSKVFLSQFHHSDL